MVSTKPFYLLRRYMCSSSLIRVSIKSLLDYRSLSHHVSYLVSHHLNQSSVSCVRTSGDGDDGGDSSSRRNMVAAVAGYVRVAAVAGVAAEVRVAWQTT